MCVCVWGGGGGGGCECGMAGGRKESTKMDTGSLKSVTCRSTGIYYQFIDKPIY